VTGETEHLGARRHLRDPQNSRYCDIRKNCQNLARGRGCTC
jgi:hypothetical protein